MTNFRIDAKNFFLTYPQADAVESKESLLEFLTTKRSGVVYCCVSKEQHADGEPHYHAILSFSTRYNLRDAAYFDFSGCHPNVQAARNVRHTTIYVKKDGDFVEFGQGRAGGHHEHCEQCTRGQWEEYCIDNRISFAYCESIWRRVHPNQSNTITDSEHAGQLCAALEGFEYDQWQRSLVLVGPTGCGKTVWALRNAPKPALFVRHLDRLRDFEKDTHKSIIFDDMVFKHIPVQAQIHLVDNYLPSDIHVRYQVASIPAGVAKIFTCNERPFEDHPAINRRCRVYLINV